MTPVPASPDPESGPPARPAIGRRRAAAVPTLSIGALDDVRAGSLLVAMPALTDPTFAGTVVYVLDHSDTGTLGVVLGRPSQVEIRDVLPGWCDLAVEPCVFHVGGPCETDTALCLAVGPAAAPDEDRGLRRVAGDVYLVDLDSDPAALPRADRAAGLRRVRRLVGRPAGGRDRRGRLGLRARRPDDVLSDAGGPGSVARGDGPAVRAPGRALHRTGRPDGELAATRPAGAARTAGFW